MPVLRFLQPVASSMRVALRFITLLMKHKPCRQLRGSKCFVARNTKTSSQLIILVSENNLRTALSCYSSGNSKRQSLNIFVITNMGTAKRASSTARFMFVTNHQLLHCCAVTLHLQVESSKFANSTHIRSINNSSPVQPVHEIQLLVEFSPGVQAYNENV
jgi:hypothetical protein